MTLDLSSSMLRRLLLQSDLDPALCRELAEAFARGGPGWLALDLLGESSACPPTRNPLLRALRRLAWPRLGELHAAHRLAVEDAAARPHGFLRLVLEEAAALEHPEGLPQVQDDEALKLFFSLAPERGKKPEKEMRRLRSRGLLYVTRRLLALGDVDYKVFLRAAFGRLGRRCPDPELRLFLRETVAMGLEREGKPDMAVQYQLEGVVALIERADPFRKVADRCAESLADAADMARRHLLSHEDVETYRAMAKTLLRHAPEDLNQPLRRRLEDSG